MNKLFAVFVAVALSAMAVPVSATPSVADRNVEYFLDQAGWDAIPEGDVELHTGDGVVTITAEEAFELLADRAGDVDLAAVTSGAATGGAGVLVGDVWLIEIYFGSCPGANILAGPTGVGLAPHPQAFLYNGYVGDSAGSTAFGTGIGWTTKELVFYGAGAAYGGISDFFCLNFFGIIIHFPFIDGYADMN